MKSLNKYLFFIILLPVFSCTKHSTFIYELGDSWDFQDSIKFEYEVTTANTKNDISIFFRNNLNYSYRNIYIFLETLHNDSLIQIDTLQYAITNKRGQWLGNGIGNTRDNYLLVDENVHFKTVGKYTFSIKHGMRQNPLLGSNKIGLKITPK